MYYASELGLGAMIYVPSSINAGSGIQNLTGKEIHRHTDRKKIA
jgi:hypothetical protein